MEANELRIGNWVKSLFCYVIIKEIYQDNKIAVRYESGKQEVLPTKDFKPIPLTPEILEMCGFKNNELYFDRDNTQYRLLSTDGVVSLWIEGYYQFGKAKYLHQLQNLYFALTGEELPINLSEPVSLSA